jgi:hypothetical protein
MANFDDQLKLYLERDADLDALNGEQLKELGFDDRQKMRRLRQFVLDNGCCFRIRPYPSARQVTQYLGECFAQSLLLSINAELTYVEGFALSPHGTVALRHAWCEDDGGLVDCTWSNEGRAYFGVRFSSDYVDGYYETIRAEFGRKWSLLDAPEIIDGRIANWKK